LNAERNGMSFAKLRGRPLGKGKYLRHGPSQEKFAMLVLTRKAGEKIHIGDQIVISVFRIQGKRARLGITAPPGISIRRQELLFEASDRTVDKEVTTERYHTLPK
jgi:carbon storage regulator CsrA